MAKLAVDSGDASTRRLAADETPPWIVLNPGAPSHFLLLGDHAGRVIPRNLKNLGLPPAELSRHIAWDIGVAGMGEALAGVLDATFIRQRFSRLVIDANRDPTRADATPEVSDATVIPGNAGLSPTERQQRFDEVSAPYHARIAAELDARAARGQPTILVSLHSFTPVMQGFARPWEFGVLHAGDSDFSRAVLQALSRSVGAERVGDNQPYRMDDVDYTVPFHCLARGLDYLELEVRQDLIADLGAQQRAADRIARILIAAQVGIALPDAGTAP